MEPLGKDDNPSGIGGVGPHGKVCFSDCLCEGGDDLADLESCARRCVCGRALLGCTSQATIGGEEANFSWGAKAMIVKKEAKGIHFLRMEWSGQRWLVPIGVVVSSCEQFGRRGRKSGWKGENGEEGE